MIPRLPTSPSRIAAILIPVVLCWCAAGCGLLRGPTATPTEFYVLNAGARQDAPPVRRRLVIGLGPVTLPPYLQRPEMVTRVAANQLWFDENNRWSEPLKDNFTYVLAADLDSDLNLERIVRYPWYSTTQMDYVVVVAVENFEVQPSGEVALKARWGIGDVLGTEFASRESQFTRPGGPPGTVAAALSELVGDLASEIASAMRQVDATRR